MTFRSTAYWLICIVTAAIAASAAEPDLVLPLHLGSFQDMSTSLQPVVEQPSRALVLFAGIMAMAYTYRRAWLNWKRAS